jgi:hypothetical protein
MVGMQFAEQHEHEIATELINSLRMMAVLCCAGSHSLQLLHHLNALAGHIDCGRTIQA